MLKAVNNPVTQGVLTCERTDTCGYCQGICWVIAIPVEREVE